MRKDKHKAEMTVSHHRFLPLKNNQMVITYVFEMYSVQMCVLANSKLRGLSPRANYTDRAAAAGRRS